LLLLLLLLLQHCQCGAHDSPRLCCAVLCRALCCAGYTSLAGRCIDGCRIGRVDCTVEEKVGAMDWAQAFFAPGAPREPAPEPEALVDAAFTEADSRLEELWRAYYDSTLATDVAKRDAHFDELVQLFLDRYQHWHPEKGVEGGATSSVTGHPVLVLGALGCRFKATVHAACEAAGRPYDGTSRALPRPELLHLLAVLSRSGSNRRSLLRWDVHTSAVRLLKALCAHMNVLAADVGPQGIWEWIDVQGWWTELEGWLRAALQIVTNYVDPTASWRLHYDFEPVDWSAPHQAQGGHANAPLGATEIATASIVDGALPALVDGLTALRQILLQVRSEIVSCLNFA
jgi:hypothetical protein